MVASSLHGRISTGIKEKSGRSVGAARDVEPNSHDERRSKHISRRNDVNSLSTPAEEAKATILN